MTKDQAWNDVGKKMKGDRNGSPFIFSVLTRVRFLESESECELRECECAEIVVRSVVRILAADLQVEERVLVTHRRDLDTYEQTFHQRVFHTEVDTTSEAEGLAAA